VNNQFPWLLYRGVKSAYYDPVELAEAGVSYNTSGTRLLNTGVRNCYGLPLLSLRAGESALFTPGSTFSSSHVRFFPNFETPSLQTVDYYFASQTPFLDFTSALPPVPGSPDFTPTNTSPLLIASVGQAFTVAGWAKQSIGNGYSDKFAYLEQYFESAYKVITDGTITTNQTGILSPYGEFLATEAGRTALVTMPDIDTAQRGAALVHVISLNLDANHDGVMDLSFSGPDTTSPNRPFRFWVNNDFDRPKEDKDDDVYYEDSTESQRLPGWRGWLAGWRTPPDANYETPAGNRIIPTMRDLQDFPRLWLSGLTPNFVATLPPGTTVTLSWGDVGNPNTNNPVIDLFQAADGDGSIGYLTNAAIASVQTNISTCSYIGRLGPGQSIQLNTAQFANGWVGDHLIWCGAGGGNGSLTLTIAQNGTNMLAQTKAHIQLMDIKQMYERWTIGDDPKIAPTNTAHLAVEDLPTPAIPFRYGPTESTNTPYILFVHGWNLKTWEKDRFAESAFKRLYWQGYQGRFGFFRWPTDYGFKGTLLDAFFDAHNFDHSENQAWKSSVGLLNKMNQLHAQYSGRLYVLAHSLGNIPVSEALRSAGANQVVNTYVASQAAVTAHTYDSAVPNYSFFLPPVSTSPKTPNIYGDRFAGADGGGAGRIINFYNVNDFAFKRTGWQLDQLTKPDVGVLQDDGRWTYKYSGSANDPSPWNNFSKYYTTTNGTTNTFSFDIVNNVAHRYEVMSFAAQSWTTALGTTPGANNLFLDVNLGRITNPRIWPPDANNHSAHLWHSGQFRGPHWLQQGYWRALLSAEDGFGLHP
jgi:hypothetical protein